MTNIGDVTLAGGIHVHETPMAAGRPGEIATELRRELRRGTSTL